MIIKLRPHISTMAEDIEKAKKQFPYTALETVKGEYNYYLTDMKTNIDPEAMIRSYILSSQEGKSGLDYSCQVGNGDFKYKQFSLGDAAVVDFGKEKEVRILSLRRGAGNKIWACYSKSLDDWRYAGTASINEFTKVPFSYGYVLFDSVAVLFKHIGDYKSLTYINEKQGLNMDFKWVGDKLLSKRGKMELHYMTEREWKRQNEI